VSKVADQISLIVPIDVYNVLVHATVAREAQLFAWLAIALHISSIIHVALLARRNISLMPTVMSARYARRIVRHAQ